MAGQADSDIIKTNHTVLTKDKWRLHLVRTRLAALGPAGSRFKGRMLPVVLIPGLCSSGTYSFDLSPAVSLADWLALQGWDVWTAELRGNGLSDKPSLFSSRSHHWTIDDSVRHDIPAVVDYVCLEAACSAVHCVGHSMGGMILSGILTSQPDTAQRIRSVTLVGSSCFLDGSWWKVLEGSSGLLRFMPSVPAGATLRLYSRLAFTRLGIREVDVLYFWPTNIDPALARALLARNFSATSPGVIMQIQTAFKAPGLRSTDSGKPYVDPAAWAAVNTPVCFLMGDKDKMCPPQGAVKQYEMLRDHADKQLLIFGPPLRNATRSGGVTSKRLGVIPNVHTKEHYGHFDILVGKHAEVEVWPNLQRWLERHDGLSEDRQESTAPAEPRACTEHSAGVYQEQEPQVVAAPAAGCAHREQAINVARAQGSSSVQDSPVVFKAMASGTQTLLSKL